MTSLYNLSTLLILGFAVIVFVLLFFISAPYGKFLRKGWGLSVKSKWAWMIMEMPSPVLMTLFFLYAPVRGLVQYIFIILWLTHYVHRTFIYSFMQSGRDKPYPLSIVSMAFFFNIINGFVSGYGIFHLMSYSVSWLMTWQFIAGVVLFIAGFIINKTADEKLRLMRQNSPHEYIVPRGWLFNYISSPHYFGEIIEWTGWAILTWSVPGLAFAVFTFANLFPRAVASHSWYRENFTDYPKNRKAVIPFII